MSSWCRNDWFAVRAVAGSVAWRHMPFGRGWAIAVFAARVWACDALGTHDSLPPDRLERSKDFGPITIALPPGFLLRTRTATLARASYGFHRRHKDLRSAATLQVVIANASKDRWSGSDAGEFRVRSLLDELARSRANLKVVGTGETAVGNVRFRRARWQATEAGDPIIGEAYAGGFRDTVVLIRIQDQERFAARTIPATTTPTDGSVAALREAMARTSHRSLGRTVGITRSREIRAVPRTPQTIGVTPILLEAAAPWAPVQAVANLGEGP